jgi:hypothetical protein
VDCDRQCPTTAMWAMRGYRLIVYADGRVVHRPFFEKVTNVHARCDPIHAFPVFAESLTNPLRRTRTEPCLTWSAEANLKRVAIRWKKQRKCHRLIVSHSPMLHHFSLSRSLQFQQQTTTSKLQSISINFFSPSSTTIPDLTISEFISRIMNLRK